MYNKYTVNFGKQRVDIFFTFLCMHQTLHLHFTWISSVIKHKVLGTLIYTIEDFGSCKIDREVNLFDKKYLTKPGLLDLSAMFLR